MRWHGRGPELKFWPVLLVAASVVASASILTIVLFMQSLRPTESPSSTAIGLIPLSSLPDDAYQITSEDLVKFPLIARVFQAYEDPSCCPGAEFDSAGFFVFPTTEEEARPVTLYLDERFQALDPDPARLYRIVVTFEGQYFAWQHPVI